MSVTTPLQCLNCILYNCIMKSCRSGAEGRNVESSGYLPVLGFVCSCNLVYSCVRVFVS